MKRSVLPLLCGLLVLLVLCASLWPGLHARCFVAKYSRGIEAAYHTGGGIPGLAGEFPFNQWPGEAPMLEFMLGNRGARYYGCYYSPQNVPLAFQNADQHLVPQSENRWEWEEAYGDNGGFTCRLQKNWFYYEAWF